MYADSTPVVLIHFFCEEVQSEAENYHSNIFCVHHSCCSVFESLFVFENCYSLCTLLSNSVFGIILELKIMLHQCFFSIGVNMLNVPDFILPVIVAYASLLVWLHFLFNLRDFSASWKLQSRNIWKAACCPLCAKGYRSTDIYVL